MAERVFMEGKLGELLIRVEEIIEPPEEMYVLYVMNEDLALTEDRWSAIILESVYEEDGFVPDEARERNMLAILDVSIVQRVVREALRDKPDASKADLAAAVDYYTDHDAFIDFSRGIQ